MVDKIGIETKVHMKVALPQWDGKVATVFDFAQELIVYTIDENGSCEACCHPLNNSGLSCRLNLLFKEEVDVLICGAISRRMCRLLLQANIEIHSNVCGEVEVVLKAWQQGQLASFRFRCQRRRRGERCRRAQHTREC